MTTIRYNRRARAYARGRQDARRLGVRRDELIRARYLANAGVTDQARAYWLGVMRAGRELDVDRELERESLAVYPGLGL